MTIQIRKGKASWGYPAPFIQLIIKSNGCQIESDVTNLNGFVEVGLIQTLREIADELEEQNNLSSKKG